MLEWAHRTLPALGILRDLGDEEDALLTREVQHSVAVGFVELEEVAEEGFLTELGLVRIGTIQSEIR